MKLISLGIILGWAAAVPIGPVNVEMAKRNLTYGTNMGLAIGFGACSVDLLFLVLLFQGITLFVNQPVYFSILGGIGSFILFYFAYKAFTAPSVLNSGIQLRKLSIFRHWFDGFIMTATNPYTIIFWGSIGSQAGILKNNTNSELLLLGLGLLIGIISWTLFLNGILHFTRKKISAKFQHYLNISGGWILFIIATISLINSFKVFLSV